MEGGPAIYIYTVAFNEPWFIQLQHRQLQQHLNDNFVYCVYDNSSKSLACYRIKKYCKQNNISYYRVSGNPHTGKDPSRSHAHALNLIFKDARDNPDVHYFGVLDHDIFPFAKTAITDKLKQQPAFGLKQDRANLTYLWPGYMFFDINMLDEEIDCMPSERGDTAAELSRYLKPKMKFANHQHKKFFDHGSAQADTMEIVDDNWIHLINGSDWAGVGMGEKKQKLQDILSDPTQLSV